LDELEDIYLAEQVLVDVKSGKESTVGLDELISKYGLED
jgi:RHH-type rel operon transcriptional repressor/antitoxin RelB